MARRKQGPRLDLIVIFSLLASGTSSTTSHRRDQYYSGRDLGFNSFLDEDGSSSHRGSSLTDDEERILSALAKIEGDSDRRMPGFSYRPRTRRLSTTFSNPQDQLPSGTDTIKRKKRVKRKRKGSKRRAVESKPTVNTTCQTETISTQAAETRAAGPGRTTEDKTKSNSSYITGDMDQRKKSVPVLSTDEEPKQVTIEATPAASHQHISIPVSSNLRRSVPTVMPVRATPIQPKVMVSSSTTPWVKRYLSTRPKDILLPVPKEYISDGFNLAQLAPIVERIGFQVIGPDAVDVAKRLVQLPSPQPSYPIYRLALQLLLNEDEAQEASILMHPLIPPEAIQEAAEALYLMVHARFVTSPRGLDALRRILLSSPLFGRCPRPQCNGTMLLPYGPSNDYTSTANSCQRYCPCCGNLWNHWESKTDGCAWGPSLCYLLLMAHGHELFPSAANDQPPPSSFEMLHHPNDPRIFGFRIHPAATWGRPLSR